MHGRNHRQFGLGGFLGRVSFRFALAEHPQALKEGKKKLKLGDADSRTNDTSCSIPDFIVLALRQLNEEFCDLVFNFHLSKDRSPIVGYCDFSIGRYQYFVKACKEILSTILMTDQRDE
jgi:hypothetical protein